MCAPEDHMVSIMMRAHAKGMTGGDYVFMYYTLATGATNFYLYPWLHNVEEGSISQEEIQERRRAFYAFKQVIIRFELFVDEIHVDLGLRFLVPSLSCDNVWPILLRKLTRI